MNKVERAVCGLRFADAGRISAGLGSMSRDLSYMALLRGEHDSHVRHSSTHAWYTGSMILRRMLRMMRLAQLAPWSAARRARLPRQPFLNSRDRRHHRAHHHTSARCVYAWIQSVPRPAAGRSPHSPRSHHLRWRAPWPSSPSSSPISESCIIASSRRGPRSHVEATRCWKSKHESTRHAHVVRSYLTPGFFGLCGGSFGMTPPADE